MYLFGRGYIYASKNLHKMSVVLRNVFIFVHRQDK